MYKTSRKLAGEDSAELQKLASNVQLLQKFVDDFEVKHLPDEFDNPESQELLIAASRWPEQLDLRVGYLLKGIRELLKKSRLKMNQLELRLKRGEVKREVESRERSGRGPPPGPYGPYDKS